MKRRTSILTRLFPAQDGYPRGEVVASCDVPTGTSRVVQDAVLAFTEDLERRGSGGGGGGGGGLDLKTILEMAEARFSAAMGARSGAAADAALDVRTVRGDDVSERKRDTASPPSVAARDLRVATNRDPPIDSDGETDHETDRESSRGWETASDAEDDGTDHVGAEDNALDSTTITRLYQNKRKCEEREERRVASRLIARLDTSNASHDARAVRSFVSAAPSESLKEGGVAASRGAGMTWEMKRAARDQIFSSSGAFQRLYSELFALQEKTDPTCACRVDAADHDVHEWDVRFPAAAFDVGRKKDVTAGCLRDDLELLEAVNGYGEVQMRVSFMPDLYPFYPPRVRVVRPRLKGIAAGALAAHPAFHLRQWQPFTPAAAVVAFARDFLVRCDARVDLECDGNDPAAFPDPVHGAYADHPSRLESALARLAACGTSRGSPITPDAYAVAYEGFVRDAWATPLAAGPSAGDDGETGGEADLDDAEKNRETSDGSRGEKPARPVSFADLINPQGGGPLSVSEAEGALAAAEKNRESRARASAKAAEKAEAWAKGTGYGYDAGVSGGGGGSGGVNGGSGNDGMGGQSTEWDASAAREAQCAEDAVVQALVAETTALIRVGARGEDFESDPSRIPRSADDRARSSANDANDARLTYETDDDVSSIEASFTALFSEMGKKHARVSITVTESLIRGSCVVAFAARELAGCAFMDMTARASYYASLLDAVDAVAALAGCANLLNDSRNSRESVAASLREVSQQARVYLRSMRAAGELPIPDAAGQTETRRAGEGAETERFTKRKKQEGDDTAYPAEWAKAAAAEISLARRILAVHDAVQAATDARKQADATVQEPSGEPRRSRRGAPRGQEAGLPRPSPPAPRGSEAKLLASAAKKPRGGKKKDTHGHASCDPESFTCESAYCEAMRDLVFDVSASDEASDSAGPGPASKKPSTVSISAVASGGAHAFADDAARDLRAGPHLARISREMAGLVATLPVSRSSSALVRVDERRVVLWSVAVTGPEETPYDCGFFLFDAFFPSAYPACAPKVRFKTTGGGRARMNPNLYKDGKVCLSLLGTWSGAKGETWDKNVSTMSQVIVSIQSLIFVADPFFNEPGFERGIGTDDGRKKSDEYNRQIREHTLRYAITQSLRKPDARFEQAIKTHFKRRRAYILGDMRTEWLRKAAAGGTEHEKEMTRLFEEARAELEKL